jgi:Sulfotransferase family
MGDRPAAPFVVGVARSGTTLLRMMLDAHPELAIPPETHFAAPVIAAFEGGGGGRDAAVRAMVGNRHWPDFGIPAENFTRAAEAAKPTAAGPLLRLFYETYAARVGKPRWGDKTPPYLDRMTSIQAVLPEAHFIHVIRDGRDVALSVIPLWFGPDDVAEAARHWSSRIEAARLQAGELEGYVEVRYEDLVGDCAATLERVCGEIGLSWDPAMLEYHRRAGERLTEVARDLRWHEGRTIAAATRSDIYRSAAEPPRGDRIGRWRREMSPADRSAFERIAGDLLGELGYAPA